MYVLVYVIKKALIVSNKSLLSLPLLFRTPIRAYDNQNKLLNYLQPKLEYRKLITNVSQKNYNVKHYSAMCMVSPSFIFTIPSNTHLSFTYLSVRLFTTMFPGESHKTRNSSSLICTNWKREKNTFAPLLISCGYLSESRFLMPLTSRPC